MSATQNTKHRAAKSPTPASERLFLAIACMVVAAVGLFVGMVIGHYHSFPASLVERRQPVARGLPDFETGDVFAYLHNRADVAMVGDSRVAGVLWGEALGRDVANRGHGWDTVTDLLERLPQIEATGARTVVIEIGINDLRWNRGSAQTFENCTRLVEALRRRHRVIVCTIIPTVSISESMIVGRVNEKLTGWCRTNGIEYIDLSGQLAIDGRLNPSLTYDGVHLNASGNTRFVAAVQSALDR